MLLSIHCTTSQLSAKACGVGEKEESAGSGKCVSIVNDDMAYSLNWMANPPQSKCQKLTTIQGIAVCEDNMPKKCLIWSTISSMYCDDIGNLEFELYWSKRCDVVIYHFTPTFKGNTCKLLAGASWPDSPRLSIVHTDMWAQKCFNCLFKYVTLPPDGQNIDVFKVQQRGGSADEFDGVQFTVLSDLYLHLPELSSRMQQIVMITAYTPSTLTDR